MSDEDEPAPSPSATVVGRRASRAAKSMRVESSCDEDTSSDEADEEWDPEQEQDEEDEEDEGNQGFADASTYGRSRLHQMPRAREDGTGEEMRNALFGKRLGRRTVHLHGLAPSGDAAFEAVEEVGREAFLPGEQGAQDHEDAFLEFLSGNIDDAGAEVRSLDQRDRKVGRFGDWLKRVGHGEYIKCAVRRTVPLALGGPMRRVRLMARETSSGEKQRRPESSVPLGVQKSDSHHQSRSMGRCAAAQCGPASRTALIASALTSRSTSALGARAR